MEQRSRNDIEFFASCLSGLEGQLSCELKGLGVRRTRPLSGGVAFFGDVRLGLKVCLWSRLAARVLAVEGRVGAANAEVLYTSVRDMAWEDIVAPGKSIAVRAHGVSDTLRNTKFTGQRVKDAICDRLREVRGQRPNVDTANPDLAIDVRLSRGRATVSVDLSGVALNKRAYLGRDVSGDASLLVSYAAGLLSLAEWPKLAADGARFVDALQLEASAQATRVLPLSILEHEACGVAADEAPGAARAEWGFFGWGRFDESAWDELLDEADERAERAHVARETALARAGASTGEGGRTQGAQEGAPLQLVAALLVAPVEEDARTAADDAAFVRACAAAPAGSRFACVGGEGAAARFGVEPAVKTELGQGRIAEEARVFDCAPQELARIFVPDANGGAEHAVDVFDGASEQFAARLRKVARERRKWARREGVTCYRIYDADLPEYACAIDLYQGAGPDEGQTFVHIAEYAPPASIDETKARRRMADVLAIVPVALGVEPAHVFSKTRRRAKGGGQYRDAGSKPFIAYVEEAGQLIEVDLAGYVDTGIFLDHRDTRLMVRRMAACKRFLNLFAYTGTASVQAAAGGASSTCTVDLSGTYLDWAFRNMDQNGFGGPEHTYERADVMRWITECRRTPERFDLIFVDPPTFSNSKAMGKRTWDVQRDHVELLIGVSRLLAEGGTAVFSCNLRTFKPDTAQLEKYGVRIEDITAQTIPHDFERNPRIHKCYLVTRKKEEARE